MGTSPPSSLPQQWREFCSSGPPHGVKIGEEKVCSCKNMGSVAEDFSQGKAVVEAQLPDGRRMLFDFLQKRCLDLNDTSKNYRLCWGDARFQFFLNKTDPPCIPLGQEADDSSPSSLRRQWQMFRRSGIPVLIGMRKGSSLSSRFPDELTDFIAAAFAQGKSVVEAQVPGGRRVLVDFLRKVVIDLDDPSIKRQITWHDSQGRFFTNGTVLGTDEQFVRRAFADGTRGQFTATSVQKCNLHYPRHHSFVVSMSLRPYVFGWYGTSASDVKEAAYGNGVVNINSDLLAPGRAHGHGVHISPLSQPIKSARLADVDKDGESHVLFCSLALGWQEVVPAGSHQDQPSSPIYDTGVDNKSDPSWYIFWSGRMQTQIAPLYIVSFIRTPVILAPGRSPLSMYDELKRSLPPSKLRELERCCDRYLKKEITRARFVKPLLINGHEDLLRAVARRITSKK